MSTMSTTDQLFAWRREDHTRGSSNLLRWTYRGLSSLTRYTLITDRKTILALPPEEPIHSSREEALAFLRSNHPSPDPRLTFILNDDDLSHRSEIIILDEPLYCGPPSISDVQSLLLRFPSLWIKNSSFLSTLPPPIHVTTKKLLGLYTRVINSPSVSKRVATRRRNKADLHVDLATGGPILPLSAFSLFPSLPSSPSAYVNVNAKGFIYSDTRSSCLSSLLSRLEDINRLLPLCRRSRRLLTPLLTKDLLLLLVAFLPHVPSLTSFPPTPYSSLHDWLTSSIQPWWRTSSYSPSRRSNSRGSRPYRFFPKNPLFDGLDSSGDASFTEPSTTNGARLAALISSTLRILLRHHKTTLFHCRLLLNPPPIA